MYNEISKVSIEKNQYSKNIEMSYIWFDKLQRAVINNAADKFPYKVWYELFKKQTKCKMIASESELHLENCKRTAIILMGLSGYGKTTYARDFVEKHPSFKACLFDEIMAESILDYIKKGITITGKIGDALGVSKFGNILEMHGKAANNIIIDGQFVYCNVRGALIKTLRELGYKNIIIFNFLKMPKEKVIERFEYRAMEESMYKEMSKRMSNLELAEFRFSMFGKDTKQMLTHLKQVEEWKQSDVYKKEFDDSSAYLKYEIIDSGMPFKNKYNLFTSGVDKFMDIY